MDNNIVKYHPHLRDSWKVMVVWKNILPCVNCDLDLGDMSLSQGHDTIGDILSRSFLAVITYGLDTVLGMCALWPWTRRYDLGSRSWHTLRSDNKCVKYYSDPTWQWGVMARTLIPGICALWPWPRRYENGSRSWHALGSWTTIVRNIIQIQHGSEELWPRHGFPVYVHRSNMAVRSYGPDMDFQYMCTVTLTLEIWPWVKVMTHPWVMDNNRVKYYPDPTWQWGVMAWTQISSMCALWPWPWIYDLKIRTHPWVMDNNCVKYYPDPTWQWGVMAWTRISSMCALWTWPWRYDLRSRSWRTPRSWTIIVWNYIQIRQGSTKLWPGHDVNRRTDRQTGWFLYTPPPDFVYGGYKWIENICLDVSGCNDSHETTS